MFKERKSPKHGLTRAKILTMKHFEGCEMSVKKSGQIRLHSKQVRLGLVRLD